MSGEWGFPNSATPPGSAAYYLARFAPPPQRDRLAAWLAWFALLDDAVRRASDPGVTRLKLDWWREESERLLHGEARHPLSRTLQPHARETTARAMRRALVAAEQRVLRRAPADLDEFLRQCRDEQASRLYLLSDLAAENPATEALGAYLGAVARLQRLGEDLRRGHRTLPPDPAIPDIETLLEERRLGAPGLDLLDQVEEHTKAQAATHYPQRALLAQHRRLARLLRRQAFPTDRLLRAAPLGLLWDAWRASRRS